ncbi:catechol 1,2-dioxygenase 1 [Aulographum hederae CBS 113979]|uniref:Catechol 1,2-dioxygenase 1 n=1 Tax=Aulographum hederae CBS 113979 TaxID=1176131 RepID=A0A6G1GJ27_9PEZI|nr:catechol 1,2-dioxygenase 1 [Aulographum hederae CBS 113979]
MPPPHDNDDDNIPQSSHSRDDFGQPFTDSVINATGPRAAPRTRALLSSLIQHIHDFARENALTVDEWMAGVDLINQAGRMSTDRRNETQLLCDILGLESLVDSITFSSSSSSTPPTASAILGPFWRKDAPRLDMGASIVQPGSVESDEHTHVYGTVTDYATGEAVEGAQLDVWQTAPNGLYEQQDEGQPDMNLRGRFTTGRDGRYSMYCLRPTSYPIPHDGPGGKLLRALDRHPMRPAHIHFIVTVPAYQPIITQIFDRRDPYISNDAVFAVKDSLVVDFQPLEGDPNAQFELLYNFKLAKVADTGQQESSEKKPTEVGSGV